MDSWKFEQIQIATDYKFDDNILSFKKRGASGLVRENIQNSLDAALDKSKPVVVTIETGTLNFSDIPGHQDIKKHINSLLGKSDSSRETVEFLQNAIKNRTGEYITFEDENTKGLSGSRLGQKDESSSYFAYAYGKGIHFDIEEESEKVRGGSHGVGKIASNSASKIHTMFFANCEKDGYQTLGGTISLNEHKIGETNYRKVGYFSNEIDDDFVPYQNIGYHQAFHKKTRGLKIIVPFLRGGYSDQKMLITSVIDGFMLALINGTLVVNVNGTEINQENVEEFIRSDEYYVQQMENIVENFTPLYYHTYSDNMVNDKFYIADINRSYRFKLYFYYNPQISKGRTAIFRTIGMKIEDKKITSYVNASYNAVLVPYSEDGDVFLKSLENEAHDTLEYDHINNQEQKDNAKRFINNITRKMQDEILKYIENNEEDRGKIDVSGILYTLENKLAHDLKKRQPMLLVGTGKTQKKIVKITNTPDPGISVRIKKGKKPRSIVDVPRVKKQFGEDGKKEYYQMPKGRISRVIYESKERISINLEGSNIPDSITTGNLLISVVDGMGKEYYNELDLKRNYKSVEDMNSFKKLTIVDNYIQGINIKDSKINLQIELDKNARKNLKLRYYLEV